MLKNSDKKRPGLALTIAMIVILPVFYFQFSVAAPPENKPLPASWRVFNAPYNRVWNALIRVLFEDSKYALRAADPDEGFIATWSKTQPQTKQGAPQRRISINVNVKKAPGGTLVTVSCVIEEYIPITGTNKGRWLLIPSDNSCESALLDATAAKLGAK